MALVCRRVEQTMTECPRCSKQLSIKTLRYKHAAFCRPLEQRLAERLLDARRAYCESMGGRLVVEQSRQGTCVGAQTQLGTSQAQERQTISQQHLELSDNVSDITCRGTSDTQSMPITPRHCTELCDNVGEVTPRRTQREQWLPTPLRPTWNIRLSERL